MREKVKLKMKIFPLLFIFPFIFFNTIEGHKEKDSIIKKPEIKLEIKMPIDRPMKNDWEGIGIKPDIEILEHLALEKAYTYIWGGGYDTHFGIMPVMGIKYEFGRYYFPQQGRLL